MLINNNITRYFIDKKTLQILVCPKCQSKLDYDKAAQELICPNDQLAFPINDGIPVMLIEEARKLAADDSIKTDMPEKGDN